MAGVAGRQIRGKSRQWGGTVWCVHGGPHQTVPQRARCAPKPGSAHPGATSNAVSMAAGRPPNAMEVAVAPVYRRGAGPQACGVDTRVDPLCLMDA